MESLTCTNKIIQRILNNLKKTYTIFKDLFRIKTIQNDILVKYNSIT